jgi:hypothetical protein
MTTTNRQQQVRHPRARGASALSKLILAFAASALVACGSSGGGGESVAGGAIPGGGGAGASAEAMAAFGAGVFPLVRTNCSTCHAGAGPGTPSVAHPDITTSYSVILSNQKVNFANPGQSRLVRRLVSDFHYCWSDCVMNGAEMQAAIDAWALAVASDPGAGGQAVSGLVSVSQAFSDGFEPQGGDRYEDNVLAKWSFREEIGTVAMDESGVAPAMDLTLNGDATFLSQYGIAMTDGRAEADATSSRKLYDAIANPAGGSQQYSLELWVQPANIDQGDNNPARIATYSLGTGQRNFSLDQAEYVYEVRNRNLDPTLSDNGSPAMRTADADEDAQAALQHVVITYDQYRGRRVYVDGQFTDDLDQGPSQRLWNWDPSFRFALGNETSSNRDWEGQIRLAAVYPFVMTDAQIQQNFAAGVGKRLLIRFDVSQWSGPGSYLEFVVSELDASSYLFCTPTFVTPNPTGFRVSNMRVSVNGQIPVSGQSFINIDNLITGTSQVLSNGCSVILKDLGPASDVFTIAFEFLSGFEDAVIPPPPPPPIPPAFDPPFPSEGFRDFGRLNATFAEVTGVDRTINAVQNTYDGIIDALPNGPDLRQFSSATEVNIMKLALEYCNALIDDTTARAAYFPGFPFGDPAAFNAAANQQMFVQALVDNMVGQNVPNQPTMAEVLAILQAPGEFFDLVTPPICVVNCPTTIPTAKVVCSSVLSSAAVSVH